MNPPITICLIDDHKIVRQGLKELLEKVDNFKVIIEFESGTEFLKSLPLSPVPDLYILDYSMPNVTGIEVLQKLEELPDEYKVLLLSQHYDDSKIDAAFNHGARGFLNKNCSALELKTAINKIHSVGYNNIVAIMERMKHFKPSTKTESIPNDLKITHQELEFLKLVCLDEELTYEQMAKIMKIPLKKIENLRASLFDRFQIKSKVGLVLFSYKYRLTEPFL